MTITRAYSLLEVKAYNDEERVLTGIATTPSTDRMGDIVEPMGVKFANPLPLLWQHAHDKPVGTVTFSKPTKAGIEFKATLPKIDEPGVLKDRVDEAWQSVKAKLVKGVSIGFRAIKYDLMSEGGIRFKESEVIELSLVTIPANADCTIQTLKQFDTQQRAATGTAQQVQHQPGDSGAAHAASRGTPTPKKGTQSMKTIAEQIASFEAKRVASDARMTELMTKAADEARTLDASETEEYDNLAAEVKGVDDHLVRLRSMEAANVARAKAVTPAVGQSATAASVARSGVVTVHSNLPKGTGFTRYAMALCAAKGSTMQALEMSKKWHDTPEVSRILKAAVDAGTTTDATWAAPLVDYQTLASEFIDLLRPQTIIGRLPSLRRVPFNVRMPRQTGGGTYGWVGEGKAKPVGELAFDEITMRWAKAAGIIVITEELARMSSPSAEAIVREDMIRGIAQFLDEQFTNPSVAEVSNVSPGAITNGVTGGLAVAATGTDADAVRADVGTLWAAMLAQNIVPTTGAWIMSNTMAMRLSLMQNPLGQPEFGTINPTGGTFMGYPVITSESVIPLDTDGDMLIFLNQNDVFLSEEGIMLDASREASLEFNTTPTEPTGASTVLVNLWQRNMVGLRAERYINWKRRRNAAVGYIYAANYSIGS